MEISRKQKKTLLTGGFGEKENDRLSFDEVASLFFKESIRQENEDKARREAAKKSGGPADLFFYNSGLPEDKRDTAKDMEALNRIKEGYPNTDIEKANNNKLAGKFYGEIQKNSKMPDNGKNQFIDLAKDPKEYLPGDKNKKLIEGINKPSEFSLEKVDPSIKERPLWDGGVHNDIIRGLRGFSPDDIEIMKAENTSFDEWRSQLNDANHAMPLGKNKKDYESLVRTHYSPAREFVGYSFNGQKYSAKEEALSAAREQYTKDNEKWREKMRSGCANYLNKAIYCKNNNRSKDALKNFTKALHILTDDYAHRQANAGWPEHIKDRKAVDSVNPNNEARFQAAERAAHLLNEMYQAGKIDHIGLDELFPQVEF